MGEEWGETRPFQYFTDFEGELAAQVREGRRNEFGKWRIFADPKSREQIPDPNAISTFEASQLDWAKAGHAPYRERLAFVSHLLKVRRERIVPLISSIPGNAGTVLGADGQGLSVSWKLPDGGALTMSANLSDTPWMLPEGAQERATAGDLVYARANGDTGARKGAMPAWSVVMRLRETQ
jgi:1,4-alpha-glucan branching enzyme